MDNPDLIPISLGFVNVYYLRGADGGVLVDTGTPGSTERLFQALSEHGVAPQDIRGIVITHAHCDHCGGLPAVREATNAPVVASRRVAELLARGGWEPAVPTGCLYRAAFGLLTIVGRVSKRARDMFDPELGPMDVDIIVDEVYDLGQFGVAGRAIATPGHTLGSLSVVLDAGDAIIGDSLMAMGSAPRVALVEDKPALGGSLARILALDPQRIHLSHGTVYTPEEIRCVYERHFGG